MLRRIAAEGLGSLLLAATVIGSGIMGERVAAFVVASEPFGLDECRSWFAERGVARFKTPERVLVVSDLPVLPAGKVDRSALRARAARG